MTSMFADCRSEEERISKWGRKMQAQEGRGALQKNPDNKWKGLRMTGNSSPSPANPYSSCVRQPQQDDAFLPRGPMLHQNCSWELKAHTATGNWGISGQKAHRKSLFFWTAVGFVYFFYDSQSTKNCGWWTAFLKWIVRLPVPFKAVKENSLLFFVLPFPFPKYIFTCLQVHLNLVFQVLPMFIYCCLPKESFIHWHSVCGGRPRAGCLGLLKAWLCSVFKTPCSAFYMDMWRENDYTLQVVCPIRWLSCPHGSHVTQAAKSENIRLAKAFRCFRQSWESQSQQRLK